MGLCLSCDDSGHGGHHRRHHGHQYDGYRDNCSNIDYNYSTAYQGGPLPTFNVGVGKVVQPSTSIPTYVSIDPAYVEPVEPVYVEPIAQVNTYNEYDRYRYILNPNTNPHNPPPYNPGAFS